MKKKIVTLYVDDELIESAKSKGVNLSKFLESKLRGFITINSPELRITNKSLPSNNQIPHIPAFSTQERI